MWRARNFPADELAAFSRVRQQFNLYPLVVHCNYLINMASPEADMRARSREDVDAAAANGQNCQSHPTQ